VDDHSTALRMGKLEEFHLINPQKG